MPAAHRVVTRCAAVPCTAQDGGACGIDARLTRFAGDGDDQAMSGLPRELRDLIESGPMAHLSTINADGSPQVSVIWIGVDGDDLVSGHMSRRVKLRNIERDPRVVLSLDAPRTPGVFLNPYAAGASGRSAERRRMGVAQQLDEGVRVP